MKSLLLPCLTELCQRYNDPGTLETVRAGWLGAMDEKGELSDVVTRELSEFVEMLSDVDAGTADGPHKQIMNAKIKLQADIGARYEATIRFARDFGILQCGHGAMERQT